MKVVHNKSKNREEATMEEKFPNVAQVMDGHQLQVQENNWFKNHEVAVVVKKYLQFTVFMEALNEVLELDRYATVETFARRISELIQKENSCRNGETDPT